MVVVHANIKQGLDHREGEFGVLGAGGSILVFFFGSVPRFILDIGTAEQSTIENCQKQTLNEGRQQEMKKPQVPQLLGGFHHGYEFAGVIPKYLVENIQRNDRGPIEPRGKSVKI